MPGPARPFRLAPAVPRDAIPMWTCYALCGALLLYVLGTRCVRPLFLDEIIPVDPAAVGRVEQRIDPNTAAWEELATLPGIGEGIARRIVEYRDQAGGRSTGSSPVFRKPADLAAVKGIGPKTLARIEPFLRFESETTPPARQADQPMPSETP